MRLRRRSPGSRGSRRVFPVVLALSLLPPSVLTGTDGSAESPGEDAVVEIDVQVTSASGPSLLTRIVASVDRTAFGQMGHIGEAPAEVARRFSDPPANRAPGWWLSEGWVVDGADLYRLNCRSCHGGGGQGLGPVIPTILDPVRAASPKAVQERMSQRGRSIPEKLARRLASRAELSFRHRLLEGGVIMPPFRHLSEVEVDALLGYLEVLAGVPASDRADLEIRDSPQRVGEHIVKANCLTCHDSVDRWPRMTDRELPTLDRMTEEYSVHEFVHKVRAGSPTKGDRRGRMPRFNYLSAEELQAAYLYLFAYPPRE